MYGVNECRPGGGGGVGIAAAGHVVRETIARAELVAELVAELSLERRADSNIGLTPFRIHWLYLDATKSVLR